MKIAIVSTFPPMHCGIGDYTKDLSRNLARVGGDSEIAVVTFRRIKKRLWQYASLDGRVEDDDLGPNLKVERALDWKMLGPIAASTIQRVVRPDLIHIQSTTFLYPPWFASMPSHVGRDTPVLITAHDVPHYRQFHMFPLLHPTYKRADALITLSHNVAEDLIRYHRVPLDKIVTMNHGVDTERFNPGVSPARFYEKYGIDESTFNVTQFGFFSRGKGIEYLLNAFKLFSRSHPGVRTKLILAGAPKEDQSYLEDINSVIRSLGIASDVLITGYLEPEIVPSALSAADVLVYPYLGVSQSGPVHLSLAMGKPVIVSDARGFKEIVTDGENGLVTIRGNAESIASAIGRVYSNGEQRVRLGRGARIFAEVNLDWKQVSAKTLKIYREVAGEGFPKQSLDRGAP